MSPERYRPLVHWFAAATLATALLPVVSGSLVTTLQAGMAFLDWPSSDGQNMILYPWFRSTGDKFAEHGHRLAGMAVGMMTLGLVGIVWSTGASSMVTRLSWILLVMVVSQGILGGIRVRQNSEFLAMVHGFFGSWTVSVLALLTLASSRSWLLAVNSKASGESINVVLNRHDARTLFTASAAALVAVAIQFGLGGMLRHLGNSTAWLIHPWFALVVLTVTVWTWQVLRQVESTFVRWGTHWLVLVTLMQASLGLATWGVKYGFPWWNIVAVQQSSLQTAVRSSHTVLGIATMAAAVCLLARVSRVYSWDNSIVRTTDLMGRSGSAMAGGLS